MKGLTTIRHHMNNYTTEQLFKKENFYQHLSNRVGSKRKRKKYRMKMYLFLVAQYRLEKKNEAHDRKVHDTMRLPIS